MGTTVVEAGHQAGQGIAVQPCQKGLALLGLVGLGREGWGVEIGAGASVAADEALFSQAGQGGHQGGQGPGSMVPQLLENLAGGQRGLGGPKNLHDLQLRLPQALAVTRGHGITSGQNYLG